MFGAVCHAKVLALLDMFKRNIKKIGRISFDYLPASPLVNGWRLALAEKPFVQASIPADRRDGLAFKADDAIDCDVQNHQRVCNRVKFSAKLSHQSYVYVKVGFVAKDHAILRSGWITCDIGSKPPRKESKDEWVIHRVPNEDGWTSFDLSLPREVSETFGRAEGLEFGELQGFRLRGKLTISPIELYRDESISDVPNLGYPTGSAEREPWTRGDKIGMWALAVAAVGIIVVAPSRLRKNCIERSISAFVASFCQP